MNAKKLVNALTVAVSLLSIAGGSCAAFASPIDRTDKSAKQLADGYALFQNSRFGFSISYPKKILKPLGVAGAASSGETFASKDGKAELCAYGVLNSSGQSLAEMLEDDIKYQRDEGRNVTVTAKTIGESWYSVAGTVDNDAFYIKAFVNGDNRINKFVFRYPIAKKEVYEQVVTQVEQSFVAVP